MISFCTACWCSYTPWRQTLLILGSFLHCPHQQGCWQAGRSTRVQSLLMQQSAPCSREDIQPYLRRQSSLLGILGKGNTYLAKVFSNRNNSRNSCHVRQELSVLHLHQWTESLTPGRRGEDDSWSKQMCPLTSHGLLAWMTLKLCPPPSQTHSPRDECGWPLQRWLFCHAALSLPRISASFG